MTSLPGPIAPPARLLMGPGPISAYPSVLTAMSGALVGQYDPFMTDTMAETQELYRRVWATENDATLLIDGTSRAGIEAAIVVISIPNAVLNAWLVYDAWGEREHTRDLPVLVAAVVARASVCCSHATR